MTRAAAGLKILFCASEVAPFAKTGGLGDVAGSLPQALGALGDTVRVVLPRYRGLPAEPQRIARGVTAHFVENEAAFNRSGLYGDGKGDYADNLERFSFFCNKTLDEVKRDGFRPDIVHAHDWQAALLPVLLKTRRSGDPFFQKTRSVMTIHNLAYQGLFPAGQFGQLGLDPSLLSMDGFEFYGKINLLKAGLVFADAVTTVSPTYAKEILTPEFGFGLDGVLRARHAGVRGIMNGIDVDSWDPASDKALQKRFSAAKPEGKDACKADLQRASGLAEDPDAAVFGIVSRLAEQKGMDILSEAAEAFLRERVQFVMLADGDAVYRTTFTNIAARHPKNVKVTIGFDNVLARKIYAGSDFFLMPSLFEPCGLGQLISFRYGTLPIVRRTGGLADTVADLDADPKAGNGFVFAERSPEKLLETIRRALRFFADRRKLVAARRRAMKLDYSWAHSAKDYRTFFRSLLTA